MSDQASPVLWGGPFAGAPLPVPPTYPRWDPILMCLPGRMPYFANYADVREWRPPATVRYDPRRIALGDQVWVMWCYAEWADRVATEVCKVISVLPWLWWGWRP